MLFCFVVYNFTPNYKSTSRAILYIILIDYYLCSQLRTPFYRVLFPCPCRLDDNEWHTVHVKLDERGQMSVRVDGEPIQLSNSGAQTLELAG